MVGYIRVGHLKDRHIRHKPQDRVIIAIPAGQRNMALAIDNLISRTKINPNAQNIDCRHGGNQDRQYQQDNWCGSPARMSRSESSPRAARRDCSIPTPSFSKRTHQQPDPCADNDGHCPNLKEVCPAFDPLMNRRRCAVPYS